MCEHISVLELHYPCPGRCIYCGKEIDEKRKLERCPSHIYPGRYCIYCREPVGEIELEDGQIILKDLQTDRARRYVAVIHKGQQKPVEWVEPGPSQSRIRFTGEGKDIGIETSELVLAFQDFEEVLRVEGS